MRIGKKSIFGIAFLCGLVGVLGASYLGRPQSQQSTAPPQRFHSAPTSALRFDDGIYVTQQLAESDVASFRKQGFATLIDIRPDGEAPDQPPSAAMRSKAQANQMRFSYIPVPHGEIPASAVIALADAIDRSPRPILLYCRSGRRAARSLSLYEASRSDGPSATTILAMARSAGQSADDLKDEIDRRIAHRGHGKGEQR
jgi:uncharacterized protein (TIGR01244 family)